MNNLDKLTAEQALALLEDNPRFKTLFYRKADSDKKTNKKKPKDKTMNNTEKLASAQILAAFSHKQADARAEMLAALPSNILASLIPGLTGGMAVASGGMAGGTPTLSDEDLEKINGNPAKAMIPGVAGFRQYKRLGKTMHGDQAGPNAPGNAWGEVLGAGGLNALLMGGAGAGLGALLASRDGGTSTQDGAVMGGSLGLGAGATLQAAGLLRGLIENRNRELGGQSEYDQDNSSLRSMLLPGSAGLNYMRRVRSTDTPKKKSEDI